MASQQLVCPKCGQIDMVQKVSAVYSACISSGNFQGNTVGGANTSGGQTTVMGATTNLKGTNQSHLSQRLSPPSRPTYGNSPIPVGQYCIFFGIGLLMIAFLSGSGTWEFSGPVGLIFLIIYQLVASGGMTTRIACGYAGVLFIGIGAFAYHSSRVEDRRMEPVHEARLQA